MKSFLLIVVAIMLWIITDDVRQIRCLGQHDATCVSPFTGRRL